MLDRRVRPKPVYDTLHRLIREEWWTDERARTDAAGRCSLRVFHGTHDIRVTLGRRHGSATVEVVPDRVARVRVRIDQPSG